MGVLGVRMGRWTVVGVVVALGCRKPEDPPPDTDSTSPTETGARHTGVPTTVAHTGRAGSGDTADASGSTGDTGTVPFDCSTVSPTPLAARVVPGARGYHGVAFDLNGYLYGQDTGQNLIRADFYGAGSVFLPGNATIQGMDTLPSGELVIASDLGAVVGVDPATGGTRTISTGIAPYGIIIGPDGLIYAGDRQNAYRIDPVTGQRDLYIPNSEAQSVGFSPDGSKFYFTKTFGPALWQVDLDANYDPIGPPSLLADFGAGYRDGIAVDICGNLYVPDYSTGKMYRIDPVSGAHITYINFQPFANYAHYAVFGSGIGGWRTDALYFPQPYNNYNVGEVVTGVPGLPFP